VAAIIVPSLRQRPRYDPDTPELGPEFYEVVEKRNAIKLRGTRTRYGRSRTSMCNPMPRANSPGTG